MKFLITLLLLVSSAFAADNIITDGTSGNVYMQDGGGKRYQALIMYTTDGNSNVVPVSGGVASSGIVTQGSAGSSPWLIDVKKLMGSDPSATNPFPMRLSDGTSFFNPALLSTAANQTTANSSLSSIVSNTANIPVPSGSRMPIGEAFNTRSDTYTVAASGTTVDAHLNPVKVFSIQVVGTGAAATAWDLRLECSLDNSHFTQVLQHQTSTGDGVVLATTTSFPCLYFRSRLASITLGSATNVVATILGLQ